MNENAKKWVDALRSGEYDQTRNYLRTDDGYCCLGVACEVAIENGVRLKAVYKDGLWEYARNSEVLPPSVQRWLGLAADDGAYARWTLAEKNDEGRPFDEIADVIESEPEGLFK